MSRAGEKPLTRLAAWGLETFFYLLYNHFAWTYDWVSSLLSLGRWQTWIESVLPYLTDDHILELGHGPGHLLSKLSKRGDHVVGLDASFFMSKLAKKNLIRDGIAYQLVRGDAESLPFSDCLFSFVYATFPSEYIADPQTQREIWRVLRPGGRLVVLPGAWITGKALPDRILRWIYKITRQSLDEKEMEAGLEDYLLLKRAKEIGFQVDVKFINFEASKAVIILADKSA
jgi:ubiquinone/menaquinone biosynthesis C-methylase UbiE